VYRNTYGAHLANDGNHDTTFTVGGVPTCSASVSEANPWWAVDLIRPTAVYGVHLTNRGEDDWGMTK